MLQDSTSHSGSNYVDDPRHNLAGFCCGAGFGISAVCPRQLKQRLQSLGHRGTKTQAMILIYCHGDVDLSVQK